MPLELLLVVLIIAGIVAAIRLPGPNGRRARKTLLIGLVLSLGGCGGALGWLGAETSGRSSLFSDVNPYLFTGVFLVGVAMMVGGAAIALIGARDAKRQDLER